MKKLPLLDLLCRRFPEYSREQLYAKVLCGEVGHDSETCNDPKQLFLSDTQLYLRPKKRYVSRGGEKLHKAIREFAPLGFEVTNAIALDAGASSGGFSDCLLQHGCKKIYAVDSGKNQLDFRLRRDPRVESFEGWKIQDFLCDWPDLGIIPPDFVVMDISFRSILGLLGPSLSLCSQRSGIFLCKPQFEYRRYCENLGKAQLPDFSGILEDELAQKVFDWFCGELMGIEILASCISPLRGGLRSGRGNREFLLYLRAL